MILNLISLATVKSQLGITATTYDSALTALIPIVSADVRRILNNQFDSYYPASFNSSSKQIVIPIYNSQQFKTLEGGGISAVNLGTVVYNASLPADTYIDSFNPITGLFTLSATPAAAGDHVYPTVNISQWPTISKMIWYRYKSQNVNSVDIKGVSSESYGPVSVSYSEKEINKKYNYPQVLIDDLGTPYARTC